MTRRMRSAVSAVTISAPGVGMCSDSKPSGRDSATNTAWLASSTTCHRPMQTASDHLTLTDYFGYVSCSHGTYRCSNTPVEGLREHGCAPVGLVHGCERQRPGWTGTWCGASETARGQRTEHQDDGRTGRGVQCQHLALGDW